MNTPKLLAGIFICVFVTPMLFAGEPKLKALSPAEDITQKTVLIGRTTVDNMSVTLEIEGTEAMWMPMGRQPRWHELRPAKADVFHIEVKPVDPASKTRISYAEVTFSALNLDTKKQWSGKLHPSWGGSGLHYGYNSPLAGDGRYEATVTIGVPRFGRTDESREMWTKAVVAKFHFKLAGTKIIEVSEAEPELK